jgi:hypothetical protein
METVRSSETSINFYQATWYTIPQDSRLHSRRRENLKFYKALLNKTQNTERLDIQYGSRGNPPPPEVVFPIVTALYVYVYSSTTFLLCTREVGLCLHMNKVEARIAGNNLTTLPPTNVEM